jgi:putative tricarboxylic transport membrane protein
MTISNGDWTVFFTRPLAATLIAIAILALVGPQLYGLFRRRAPVPKQVPGDA